MEFLIIALISIIGIIVTLILAVRQDSRLLDEAIMSEGIGIICCADCLILWAFSKGRAQLLFYIGIGVFILLAGIAAGKSLKYLIQGDD